MLSESGVVGACRQKAVEGDLRKRSKKRRIHPRRVPRRIQRIVVPCATCRRQLKHILVVARTGQQVVVIVQEMHVDAVRRLACKHPFIVNLHWSCFQPMPQLRFLSITRRRQGMHLRCKVGLCKNQTEQHQSDLNRARMKKSLHDVGWTQGVMHEYAAVPRWVSISKLRK